MGNELAKVTNTVVSLIEKSRDQIARALPRHVSPDRLLRVAVTTLRRNPDLARCDQYSLIGAIMQAAQLGLEPDGILGRAYLVPFAAKGQALKQVQLIVGYRGLMDLARRSGEIVAIYAHVVRERDQFSVEFGLAPKLTHIPFAGGDAGEITGAYAVATFRAGGAQCEHLWRWEIDEIRKSSKASGGGPWVTHYAEMAKKTAVRRLCKYLPASVELMQALSLEDSHDMDVSQDLRQLVMPEPLEAPTLGRLDALTDELEATQQHDDAPLGRAPGDDEKDAIAAAKQRLKKAAAEPVGAASAAPGELYA